jgi:flagellar biosynthesis protein FlhA
VNKYSILTIGDGLITQIPALITATASGMLVTKATSESSLGQEIGIQFGAAAGPMRLGSFILMGLAIMPGMPWLPFLALGLAMFGLAQRLSAPKAPAPMTAPAAGAPRAPEAGPAKSPTEGYMEDFLQLDRI